MHPAHTVHGGVDLEESHDSIDSALQSSAEFHHHPHSHSHTHTNTNTNTHHHTPHPRDNAHIATKPPVRNHASHTYSSSQKHRGSRTGVSLSPMYRSNTAPLMDTLEHYSTDFDRHGTGVSMDRGSLPPPMAHMGGHAHHARIRAGTSMPQQRRDPALRTQLHGERAKSSAATFRPSKNALGSGGTRTKSIGSVQPHNYSNRRSVNTLSSASVMDNGGPGRQLSPVSMDFISKHQIKHKEFVSSVSNGGEIVVPARKGVASSGGIGSGSSSGIGASALGKTPTTMRATSAGGPVDSQKQKMASTSFTDPRFSLMVGGSATGIRVQSRRANEIRKATSYDNR